jgi:hypothetical protein
LDFSLSCKRTPTQFECRVTMYQKATGALWNMQLGYIQDRFSFSSTRPLMLQRGSTVYLTLMRAPTTGSYNTRIDPARLHGGNISSRSRLTELTKCINASVGRWSTLVMTLPYVFTLYSFFDHTSSLLTNSLLLS